MLAVIAGLFGLIIGSFINVLVLRRGALSLSGRSHCFSCGAQIHWYDNLPVLSWLLLRGRCRTCRSGISVQYPLVEALTAALFAAAAHGSGEDLLALSLLDAGLLLLQGAFIALLVAISVYDMRHTIIPDAWSYLAALCALAIALLERPENILFTLLAGPAAAAPLFFLWYVSRGRWMGLGDPKLALSIGFFLGPIYGLMAVFYAFIVGAVVSVFILLPLPHVLAFAQKQGIRLWHGSGARFTMKSEVGFGPFLALAFFIVWFSLLYHLPLPL